MSTKTFDEKLQEFVMNNPSFTGDYVAALFKAELASIEKEIEETDAKFPDHESDSYDAGMQHFKDKVLTIIRNHSLK